MKTHCYTVYIIASKSRVIYIGMTNDLSRRVFEHKIGLVEGFTKQFPLPSPGVLRILSMT